MRNLIFRTSSLILALAALAWPPSANSGQQGGAAAAIGAEQQAATGYRIPYSVEYLSRFRPGYRPFVVGDVQYYGYYNMPAPYLQTMINGVTYYISNGVYYLPRVFGGQTVYLAVPDQ